MRSIFDHACIVWRPCSENLLRKFEKIQKRAVKWVLSEQDHHYGDYEYFRRLQDLDLLPIEFRLILSDLIFFHQIFYQLSTVTFPDYLEMVDITDLNEGGGQRHFWHFLPVIPNFWQVPNFLWCQKCQTF